MKNFTLEEAPASRREPFLLLHLSANVSDADREFIPFSRYAKWLSETKGYSQNTIISYCQHTARFIDYVYEASFTEYFHNSDFSFEDIISSYQSYLLFAKDSSHTLAHELALRLDKTGTTSQASISQNIESAVRSFLEVSMANPDKNPDPLFARLLVNKPQYRSRYEVSAIKANSWLAGTIKDSLSSVLPQRKGQKLFPTANRRISNSGNKAYKIQAFPIELSTNLITLPRPKSARTYWRDIAFYSLLAASGARTHEALQIRMCDIMIDEFGEDTVKLFSPFSRKNPGITEEEYKELAWKGRETSFTFLIEPFASTFWHALSQYIDYEYNSSVNHDFLFQNSNGRPFFTSDRSNRDKTFKKYAKLAGVKNLDGICLHSLRHMYGTYILNYMPMPDNELPGLPIAFVQVLMGHASLSSTSKYAKRDEDVINAYVEHANQQMRSNPQNSLLTVRRDFHKRQLDLIENEIDRIQAKEYLNDKLN